MIWLLVILVLPLWAVVGALVAGILKSDGYDQRWRIAAVIGGPVSLLIAACVACVQLTWATISDEPWEEYE